MLLANLRLTLRLIVLCLRPKSTLLVLSRYRLLLPYCSYSIIGRYHAQGDNIFFIRRRPGLAQSRQCG